MGKKYVVEIGRLERLYKASVNGNGKPNLTWLSPEVDLTPYTEPDLEQVRKEAYAEGFKDAAHNCEETCTLVAKARNEGYNEGQRAGERHGMKLAWDAARKIVNLKVSDRLKFFNGNSYLSIFDRHTASEAIEKLKTYEQEQEYHVGDEFENGAGQKFVVLKMDGKEIDRYVDGDGKTYVMDVKYNVMRKTGRHFPEIATILEKMRGEQDE